MALRKRIDGWMDQLARSRPVFHSEIDFQLALSAVMIADGAERVRLERRHQLSGALLGGRRHLEIDIMGRLEGLRIALELKYPKDRFSGVAVTDDELEDFHLPPGGAPDVDAAAIWRDVERIERLLADDVIDAGATVVLSNYPFWSSGTMRVGTKAHAFRLWEGRHVSPQVLISAGAGHSDNDGAGRVNLASSYECRWLDYSHLIRQSGKTEFRYLTLESVPTDRALMA